LQLHGLRQQQIREIRHVSEYWSSLFGELASKLDDIEPASIKQDLFRQHSGILDDLKVYEQAALSDIRQMQEIVSRAIDKPLAWDPHSASGSWWDAVRADLEGFQRLRADLESKGLDPQSYEDLLRKQATTEQEIQDIATLRQQIEILRRQLADKAKECRKQRKALTSRRRDFLNQVLKENTELSVSIKPFGQAWPEVESRLREILQVDRRFDRDFEELREIFEEEGWESLKKGNQDTRTKKRQAKDMRFQQHLQRLSTEAWVDFQLWTPEDALHITHGSDNRMEIFSPGRLPNTLSVDNIAQNQYTRNELLARLLSECSVEDPMRRAVERDFMLERRGEGVGIILRESEALSGRLPIYEQFDPELKLTIYAADTSKVLTASAHPHPHR